MKVTLRAPLITPSQAVDRGENCFADAPLAVLDVGVELEGWLDRCVGMDVTPSIVIAASSNRQHPRLRRGLVDIRVYADAMQN